MKKKPILRAQVLFYEDNQKLLEGLRKYETQEKITTFSGCCLEVLKLGMSYYDQGYRMVNDKILKEIKTE